MDISDNFLLDFFKDIPKTELIGLFGLINRKKLNSVLNKKIRRN